MRVQDYINGMFCLTYGDDMSDIKLSQLISYHQEQKTLVTVPAIQLARLFGSIEISVARVKNFLEKPKETTAGLAEVYSFVIRVY